MTLSPVNECKLLSLAQIGSDVVRLNYPETQAFGRRSGD
jgi:hypothetical protein